MKNVKAYAQALLDLCQESNIDANQVVSELKLVSSYFDEEFIKFLNSPKIKKQEKQDVISKSFPKVLKQTHGLLMVLIDNNAILSINDICKEVEEMMDKIKGIVNIEVCSVKPLTKQELNSISLFFIKKLNKVVKIKEVIDTNLVGGLIIKYEGKIIDGSLFSKHESLKEYLKK